MITRNRPSLLKFLLIADSAVLLWTALFSWLLFATSQEGFVAMLWLYREPILYLMHPPLWLFAAHVWWLHRHKRLNVAQGVVAVINAALVYGAGYLIFLLTAFYCETGVLCPAH